MHNDTLKAALMYFKHFFNENNFAIDKRETAKLMKSFLIVDWINFWTSDDGIASRSLLIVDFFFRRKKHLSEEMWKIWVQIIGKTSWCIISNESVIKVRKFKRGIQMHTMQHSQSEL